MMIRAGRIALCMLALLAGRGPAWSQDVKVLHEDARGLVLAVTAPEPHTYAHATQRGSVETRIPGAVTLELEGMPVVPYSKALIGVPEGMRPVVRILGGREARWSDDRLAVSIHPSFGLTEADGWEAPADPVLPRGRYPRRQVEVAWTGWLRDAHVAEIRFYPVRSAGAGGGILYAHQILARVDFVADGAARSPRRAPGSGTEPEAAVDEAFHEIQRRALINADHFVPAPRPAAPVGPVEPASIEGLRTTQSGTPAPLKISVNADGLYRVTPADLTAAGINLAMVNPQNFRIEFLGNAVPMEVLGEGDGTFDPNDRIVFYGRAATGRYTRTNVYWLHFDGGSTRAAQRSGAFGSPATTPTSFVTTVHAEQDLIYTQNIPPAAIDHWWWKLQSAGDPNSASLLYSISLPGVDPTLHTVNVRVNIQGRTLATANPDHHTRIFLNGTQIDDRTWDGQISFTHSVSVSSGLLINGSNTVQIVMVGDTGAAADQVYTNFIEVDYRKTYAAASNSIVADGEGSGSFRFSMTGFATNDILLYDATDPAGLTRVTVPGGQITGAGPFTLGFQDSFTSDRLYAAATTAGLKSPAGIVQDLPSTLKSASNGADFIAITPPEFVAALQPLLTLRASQGRRVLVATTDDIYDEFNFGIFDPAAIKSFLSYAYANYASPAPQFVLLNGDAHIDYLDNLGSGVKQFVPATLIVTPSIGEVPSDNQYVAVAGGDNLPEMFVGRFPVRSAADVTTIVNKILAYENAPPVASLNAQSLFVADNDESSFEAVLTSLATLMPPTMAANNIFLSQLGTAAATKTAIINGMDAGALLTTYLGHGSATQWAAECIWATGGVSPCFASDQNLLAASNRPTFIVALNCINGYFIDLTSAGAGHVNFSLAEQMERKDSRAGIAVWAPTGLANASDYSSIGDWLYRNVFLDRDRVIGHATTMAAIAAVTQPLNPADLMNMDELILFGDPATNLALDSDGDGLTDKAEEAVGMNPVDGDSDDDGVGDGQEASYNADTDGDGLVNGLDPDSDNDGILDGTERGITAPAPGTDTSRGFFVPDADPNTTTDPLVADTDGGGVADGAEDRNFNGKLDPGETDPRAGHAGDDPLCTAALAEMTNLRIAVSGPDLLLTWDAPPASQRCSIVRVYAEDNAPKPKNTFSRFHVLGVSGSSSFTHLNGAIDGASHDYLVVEFDPLHGEGPLGHYGR
ncbi:MAG: hypothetical protein HY049_06390 [Acidobacteria bacterium]|nr:hypothetical protein [Acidobacteriota bacterium]